MIIKYYSKSKLVLMCILGIVASTENIVMAYMTGTLVNIGTTGQLQKLPRFLVTICLLFLVVFCAKLGYNYLKNDAIRQTNSTLRTKIFNGMLHEERAENSAGLSFLTSDFKLLETNRFGAEINIAMSSCMLVLSLSYAFYINWLLTILFFVGSAVPMFVVGFFQKPLQKASDSWTDANEQYVNQTKNFLAGADSLRLYRRQQSGVVKNQRVVNQLEKALARMNLLNDNSQALVNLVAEIGTFLVPILVGIYLIVKGQTTLGALFAVVQLSNSFVNPILTIMQERNHFSTTKNIVAKIKQYLSFGEQSEPAKVTDFKQAVTFSQIALARKQQLAHGINLEVKKGQKIAIIGPSGSGKSTLFQFLLSGKFGQAAKISVDGQDYSIEQLTDLFAYASQAPVIFANNLWFNLTLGAEIPAAKVKAVCSMLQLDEIVQEKGFDYQLGENADQLSGGQLARIELARAILAERPILLLDEINASLDRATANKIHHYLLNSDLTFVEVIHHYEANELKQYDQVIDFNDYQ
ncbi:ABC transporter ATP-binding protein [Lactobacillus sp. ESL0731]|uniref:ATP-binding cassette domain-containing protein n=1 Tax=unclassified Lactobacillus TaxID=2620435 RepID=UPI0023F6FA62|nr:MULTISPECIES: ABC transporter ATP-binding protein [unclassified Lactobacillus]WEV50714.1 ABC transporter ATP-binding protein [Lactobacillus sp. ESL0700]WEV61844.1 ABC transporter ATP-binding protein [Lactobacillus sp. ESL0731]